MDYLAPLYVEERIYDVLQLRIEEGGARPRRGLEVFRMQCSVEVQGRADQTYRAFVFYIHDSAFARGEFSPTGEFDPSNPDPLLRRVRISVWEYLQQNRQPLARSRWAQPVVLELR